MDGFTTAREFLYSLGNRGIKLGLEPISDALKNFSNPHLKFNSVLIAGTNGKGSVASMLASIIASSGYKVGLYTSPHLFDIRERIKINGEKIEEDRLVSLVDRVRHEYDKKLTFFEFVTLISFIYFAQKGVDLAILEVGLGGRFDATNVIRPILSVITNVEMDHEEYLGSKLEGIAFEKAGIIKTDGALITSEDKDGVLNILGTRCKEMGSKFLSVGNNFSYQGVKSGLNGVSFDFISDRGSFRNLKLALLGDHQAKNASLAVYTCLKLKEFGYKMYEKNIRRGLRNTLWKGRLELVNSEGKMILLDCAHNVAGVNELVAFLRKTSLRDKPMVLIYGTLADKNYEPIIKALSPLSEKLVLSMPIHPRALNPEKIKALLFKNDEKVHVEPQLQRAYELAHRMTQKGELICITGSTFLVGPMLHHVKISHSKKEYLADMRPSGNACLQK